MASLGTIEESSSSSGHVSVTNSEGISALNDVSASEESNRPENDHPNSSTPGDSDSEQFHFPGAEPLPSESAAEQVQVIDRVLGDEESEEFHFPGADPLPSALAGKRPETLESKLAPVSSTSLPLAPLASNSSSIQKRNPSPAQLEALHAAASSGDLQLLQNLFKHAASNEDVEEFALANDASSRTGLTALHAAASRGHIDVVMWLIEQCGAMPDMEDKEGETALHKASLNGHLPIVSYLLHDRADVHCQDADGWTALHNACSKGYLDIVRCLCESGGAADTIHGVPGVDLRSKGGWTPLMNAASKGHLPVVLYLLNKQSANPLIRNNWGETAYDAAAAVFEIWICEVLQKFEADKWRESSASYDPLAVHTTVPLVVYENERLDTRLKTLALSGGRPRFSYSGLRKHGGRAPFELKLPKIDPSVGKTEVPALRADVQLPLRENPWTLPLPGVNTGPLREGAERSHFWLSDWTVDITHPNVDANNGWQYANFLTDPDEVWSAEMPLQLQRLLSGSGAVTATLSGQSASRASASRASSLGPLSWVRRRRWVRVMRRRFEITPLPFLEPDGLMYHFTTDGERMVPFMEPSSTFDDEEGGQELGMMPSTGLSSAQDYVARARYLAGNNAESDGTPTSPVGARRAIAKLERAITELRQGMLNDEDLERKTQAEVLINTYSRELQRRRLDAGSRGLLISGSDSEEHYDSDSDESFHYPGAEPIDEAPSIRSADYPSRQNGSSAPADLTLHLSQAPEFRVPTHESPQKVLPPRWTSPSPRQLYAQWERDENARECRICRRRFNFLNRRHHCRRCGHIFCDRCSSYRALLDPSDVVYDPALSIPMSHTATSHRVCQSCSEEVNSSVPEGMQRTTSMERIVIAQPRLSVPSPTMRQTSSQLSDLAECPVCNENLEDLGPPFVQENHVKNCLEGGAGASPQAAKYLVYKLPSDSSLVGIECVICLEEFQKGSMVARLSCLCSFHNVCLSSWLQRGRSCPVHSR